MDECVTSYITKLKNLALHCEFQNHDEEIKDTFVATCHDINLKRKSLKEKKFTLRKCIAIAKEHESITVELREMETKNRDTELELLAKVSKSKRKIEKRKERHQRKSKNICFKCGNKFTPGHLKNCSALGRKCDICGKLNHSVSACRGKEQDQVKYKNLKSKKVNKVENTTSDSENSSESSSESDCFVIFEKYNQNKIEKNHLNSINKTKSKSALIKINSKNISVLMDTDSGATIIDNETFKKIQKGKANIQLHKTKMKLFPYGVEKPLEILGKFTTLLETNNKVAVCDLFVVNKSNSRNILGFSMCTELQLIKLNNDNNVNKIESEGENKQKTKQPKAKREIPTELECIIDEYKDTFKGTGKRKTASVIFSLTQQ